MYQMKFRIKYEVKYINEKNTIKSFLTKNNTNIKIILGDKNEVERKKFF